MRSLILGATYLLISVFLAAPVIAETKANDGFLIAADDPRLERPESFIFLGKQASWNNDLLKPTLARFPNIRACLRPSAFSNGQYDLRQFDWDALRAKRDAEICVFFITRFFETSDAMQRWFLTQNVSVSSIIHDKDSQSDTLPVHILRVRFLDYVSDPNRCSFMNVFVWPWLWPEDPDDWRLRKRYYGMVWTYKRDGSLHNIQPEAGSCLN